VLIPHEFQATRTDSCEVIVPPASDFSTLVSANVATYNPLKISNFGRSLKDDRLELRHRIALRPAFACSRRNWLDRNKWIHFSQLRFFYLGWPLAAF
jgi:hypothetical protein